MMLTETVQESYMKTTKDLSSKEIYLAISKNVFMLPEGLEKGKFYIVKVQYYTEGNPRPYIIVSEEPYSADNLSLHDKMPLLPKQETKDFPFSPRFSSSSPKIIFRNWSTKGKFVITQFQICKTAAYIKD